jgi:hypothetical protein
VTILPYNNAMHLSRLRIVAFGFCSYLRPGDGKRFAMRAQLRGIAEVCRIVTREALGNKVVKRSLRSDLFLMNVLGAD